jgi:ribosomal protein RSM22 (predicted rRNA methylase)
MQLPAELGYAIEQILSDADRRELARAAAELSAQYRARTPQQGACIRSALHRRAYMAVRLPATYAAVCAALAPLAKALSGEQIATLLDLGAGSGSASWAAQTLFADIETCTLLERDPELVALGRALAQGANNPLLQQANWLETDLCSADPFPAADLVIASYALNELSEDAAIAALLRAWTAARIALVVVEPGTQAGFALIKKLRRELVGMGAYLLAPCPHAADCPLPVDDWCHFAQRVARTSLHRSLKGGDLGHEDEKFSYLVFTKQPLAATSARILRHPQRRSGHIHLSLCTKEDLAQITVTRSDKLHWKDARKAQWGDSWPAP